MLLVLFVVRQDTFLQSAQRMNMDSILKVEVAKSVIPSFIMPKIVERRINSQVCFYKYSKYNPIALLEFTQPSKKEKEQKVVYGDDDEYLEQELQENQEEEEEKAPKKKKKVEKPTTKVVTF